MRTGTVWTPNQSLQGQFVPLHAEDDWRVYVTLKVKGLRAIALPGREPFVIQGFEVPRAIGLIELVGPRKGLISTCLRIGFSLSESLAPPTFTLRGGEAIGTITLPADCFGPWMDIAKAQHAHFRIGGDGAHNAIASDASFLPALH